jgi:putative ATPase
MLESGQDPLFVARRLIRFASEDVGLADPNALVQATAGIFQLEIIFQQKLSKKNQLQIQLEKT